jgi:hypothetical protein
LILKATSERSKQPDAQDPHASDPNDLRWRQTDPTADVAMPTHAMH